MSQRVAGCCCGSPCDPTLGVCCTKVGGVCDCITDKTLCECTKLGGVWNANNLCPNGCLGSCCKFDINNALVDCTNNITECACAAMATARRTYTTFHRGLTCANNPCSACLQSHTCQTNRIFNIAVNTFIYTFSNSYVCACYQDNPKYNNRSESSETPYTDPFSFCGSARLGTGFVVWYDDQNLDPSCIGSAGDSTETIITDCEEGGLTGSVTRNFQIKFTMLAQITVPPCGTWIKAGTFKKEMVRIGSGCGCYPGQENYGNYAYTTTYCWPPQDWPLYGCNYNGRNFDIVNPYNSTTSPCIPGTTGTYTDNNCF